MKPHLKGVVACISGDLNTDADSEQWTDENIKRWLDIRGGKLVDEMSGSVTHLLCSKAAWVAQKSKVRQAIRLKKCKIVTYEWLDDAILLYDQLKRNAPMKLYHPGAPRPEKEIVALYGKRSQVTKKLQADPDFNKQDGRKADGNVTEQGVECPTTLEDGHERKDEGIITKQQDLECPALLEDEHGKKDNGNITKKHVECPTVFEDGHRKKGDGKNVGQIPPAIVKHNQTLRPPNKRGQNPKALGGGVQHLDGIPHRGVPFEIYHIYRDPMDDFPYQVEVSCPDTYGNPQGMRWILQLSESKSAPKKYRFSTAYFEKQGGRRKPGRGSRSARHKHVAMKEFTDFFVRKTGIKWEERFSKKAREQPNGYRFTYHPPAPGEPVGVVDPGYRPKRAEGTNGQRQSDADAPSRFRPGTVSSLKRKRSDSVGPQHAKVAKDTHEEDCSI